ncbi:MAG: Ppx/GppA phosphatase family protein [Opitutaceae bacterium]
MAPSDTVAAIDVGSNSIKLLVARRGSGSDRVETVFTKTIETRISAGISREFPRLSDEAIHEGTKTIAKLAGLAREFNPQQVKIVATSAVRDALNGDAFIKSVKDTTDLQIQILSGTDEATLIGKGLACDPEIQNSGQFIQMDIGGGSLELVRFDNGSIQKALSLQLGAVRLTERFLDDREAAIDLETENSIREHVEKALEESGFPFQPTKDPLIATGGAFTVTRAVLAAEAGTTIDHFKALLTKAEITALKTKLCALPLCERTRVPHLPTARADIITTALITIETLLTIAQREQLTHSFYNLRYGLVAEMLEA